MKTHLLVRVHAGEALLAGASAAVVIVGRGLVTSAAAGLAALGGNLLDFVLGSGVVDVMSARLRET